MRSVLDNFYTTKLDLKENSLISQECSLVETPLKNKKSLRKKMNTSSFSSNFRGFFIYKVCVFHSLDFFPQEDFSIITFQEHRFYGFYSTKMDFLLNSRFIILDEK